MATIFCFDKCNVGIAQDFLASSGEDANERVIGCVQDEGGYGDTVHNMCGCSAIVVIRGAREPAIVSGEAIVSEQLWVVLAALASLSLIVKFVTPDWTGVPPICPELASIVKPVGSDTALH